MDERKAVVLALAPHNVLPYLFLHTIDGELLDIQHAELYREVEINGVKKNCWASPVRSSLLSNEFNMRYSYYNANRLSIVTMHITSTVQNWLKRF